MTRIQLAIAANIVIVVLELIGTRMSLSNGGAKNFIWYTVLSNVMALAASACYAVCGLLGKGGEPPQWVSLLKYGAAVCLSVTFLVVVFVLVPMAMPSGTAADVLYKGPQIYHHILCPLISAASFVFLEPAPLGGMKLLLIAAAPTLLYATVFVILNLAKVVHGPYPFLYVYEQPWFMSVFWFAAIVGLSAGLAAGLLKLSQHFG